MILAHTPDRVCGHCGKKEVYAANEHPRRYEFLLCTAYEITLPVDPCIGRILPGVVHCCCGHGVQCDAYVTLSDELPPGVAVGDANEIGYATTRLGGAEALRYLQEVHGVGPPDIAGA